jgi:hypothetical protein
MSFVKGAAIAWSVIYFIIGAVFSLTLGSNDFWSGAAVYLALFLLPLPIAFIALWFPRIAGAALVGCVVVSVCVSTVSVIRSGPAPDLLGFCKFAMLHIPHLIFAAVYAKLPSPKHSYSQTEH